MGKGSKKAAKADKACKSLAQIDVNALAFLVAPEDSKRFLETYWEKKPEVFRATLQRKTLLANLFSLKEFIALLTEREAEGEPLEFGEDVNAARYVDGERETPNGDEVDAETVEQLFEDGCTMQVHQPQRFNDVIWRLCSALEAQLGCLVGCNTYITPAGTQGLAPHHDDVEIFVCQTEGSKRWRLYAPLDGFALPTTSSKDLPEEVLGEPVMDVVLNVGDVLYMPRGTIHQAVCDQAGHSTHLTLSTYQRWTWGELAQHTLHTAMSAKSGPACAPQELRAGLPIGFLYQHGLQAEALRASKKVKSGKKGGKTNGVSDESTGAGGIAAVLADALRKLADVIEQHPQLVGDAADSMAADFMRSRAPPFATQRTPQGEDPTVDGRVVPTAASVARVVPYEVDQECVKVLSCLNNSRARHMMPSVSPLEDSDSDEDGEMPLGIALKSDSDDEAVPQLVPMSHGNGKAPSNKHKRDEGERGGKSSCKRRKECATHKADEDDQEDYKEAGGGDKEEDGGACCEEEDCCGMGMALEGLVGSDIVFPAEFTPALCTLLGCTNPRGVAVRDVPLEDDEAKLQLCAALWAEGILACVKD